MTKRNFKPRQIIGWAAIALLCVGCLPAGAATAQEVKPPAAERTFFEPEPAPPRPVEILLQPEPAPPRPVEILLQPEPAPPCPVEKLLRPTTSEPKRTKSIPVPVAKPAGKSTVKLYALKYADAGTILQAIWDMPLPGAQEPLSVTLDERTNSVLVLGPPETHQHVSKIIEQLDVPRDANLAEQLRMYSLVYADPASVAEVLSNVLTLENTRIAVDQRTRSILVGSSEETLERVEVLLSDLDVPAAADSRRLVPGAMLRVRVVWLADGFQADDAPPAKNLDEVVAELEKVGLEDVRQVGQVMVNVMPDGRFELSGAPKTDRFSADWKIAGRLDQRQETPTMDIQISAAMILADDPANKVKLSVQLQTEIAAPLGHYVVLGITPVGNHTSAFVVQITSGK